MSKNVASTIPAPNLIKDALYYLHPDVATNEKYIAVGRGQLSGVITTVMALQGCTFEDAVAFVVPHLPSKIVLACIPKPWHDEFLKQGDFSSITQTNPQVGRIVGSYARMLGVG